MHSASEASAGVAFGRFLLLPHRRELLADGRPVKLGGRAFDVLLALIEARGAVVSKDAFGCPCRAAAHQQYGGVLVGEWHAPGRISLMPPKAPTVRQRASEMSYA